MSFETYLRVGIDASGSTAGANVHKQATDKIVNGSIQASDAQKKFEAQVKTAKVALLAFATTAATLAVREIGNYTQALSNARAMTGATGADLQKMERVIRDLGASTSFSATQVADAAAELGQAGFKTEQVMGALPVTLDLAAAATIGIADASRITANVMAGFGLSVDQVGEAADVLGAISVASTTDVAALGEAMKYAGLASKPLGISLQTTAAAMAVLAQNGITGGQAGRSYKSMLASLLNPSKDASEAIESLGLNVKDVNPQFNSFETILKRLSDAGIGATEEVKIFGVSMFAAADALISQVPLMTQMIDVANNAGGSLRKIAEIKLDNLWGDLEKLGGALSELALIVGDLGLEAAVRSLLQTGASLVDWINQTLILVNKNREQAQLLADTLNVVKNAVIALMVLKLANWLFVAGSAMRVLNIAVAANPWISAGTAIGAMILHLKDLKGETDKMTGYTKKQTDEVERIGNTYSVTAAKALRASLVMQRTDIMGGQTISDIQKQIAEREAQQAELAAGARAINPASGEFYDPGTRATAGGFQDKYLAELKAKAAAVTKLNSEIARVNENIDLFSKDGFKKGFAFGKSVIDGISSASWQDVKNFLGSYVPLLGRGVIDDDPGKEKAKESFMVKELANAKLALELSKNLGAAESELYRIRLQSEALQEAKAAGLKTITTETQKMIDQAVLLSAEETKNTERFEAQKNFTDQIKEKYKAQQAALSVAQNLGATESQILRMQLESQASEAARKAGLDGISQAWQSIIDKIVVVSALEAEAKKNYELQQKAKKAVEDKAKELEIETRRNELTKQYSGNLRELDIQMQIFNATREAGIQVGSTAYTEMEKKIRKTNELKKNTKEVTDATEKAAAANKEWAKSMTYAFKDAIMNSKNLGDALSNLANKVQNMLVNKALDSLLGGLFSGFAKGDVFSGGRNMAFAAGGVVNGPTIFPMANGMGLMGEAGPEAIMPLTRTSSGELGVQAVGGGSGGVSIVNQFEINIEGGNKEENEDAANQVSSAIMRIIDDKIVNVILREKRPGGALR